MKIEKEKFTLEIPRGKAEGRKTTNKRGSRRLLVWVRSEPRDPERGARAPQTKKWKKGARAQQPLC